MAQPPVSLRTQSAILQVLSVVASRAADESNLLLDWCGCRSSGGATPSGTCSLMARRKRSSGGSRRKSPIRIKAANRGKLRAKTKTKKGAKIPIAKLQQMKRSKSSATRRQATFALNARKWGKRKRKA